MPRERRRALGKRRSRRRTPAPRCTRRRLRWRLAVVITRRAPPRAEEKTAVIRPDERVTHQLYAWLPRVTGRGPMRFSIRSRVWPRCTRPTLREPTGDRRPMQPPPPEGRLPNGHTPLAARTA